MVLLTATQTIFSWFLFLIDLAGTLVPSAPSWGGYDAASDVVAKPAFRNGLQKGYVLSCRLLSMWAAFEPLLHLAVIGLVAAPRPRSASHSGYPRLCAKARGRLNLATPLAFVTLAYRILLWVAALVRCCL